MLADLPIRFEHPIWFLLLLLIVPVFLVSLRSIGGLSRTKTYVAVAVRALVLAGLAVALAEPIWEKRGRGLTVSVLLDRSQSIPLPLKQRAEEFLRRAVDAKERAEDRVAVITIAKDANIMAMADALSRVDVGGDVGDLTATNLAGGVRLALAIMPDDTANRIVLASDGNETVDSVLAAAEIAQANRIPIDIVLLEYEYENEVVFERIVVPAQARQGQTVKVKLLLNSQGSASGTVRLRMNGVTLDLNGAEPGDGLHVDLAPGATALEQLVSLDESGPHQFDAVFIPDDPGRDAIERNNSAVAVTFVSGEGKVLVVDDGVIQSRYLVQALRESGMTVDVRDPGAVNGLVTLSGYDSVVITNIPRWAFDEDQDRMLHAYVHDLGGGLMMIGGAQSFGAGGWIDSEVARTLPVKLNPPDTRQMPAGALALIMHSCEMAQGNFWGQKVAESAIEALSRLDYAGIVEYNWAGGGGGIQGCSWAFPMQRVGDKRAALAATKTMQVGDMPSFGPSMQLAFQGLTGTTAAQRHAIIISDGDPSPPKPSLLRQYADNRITVTTVMVGGHGTAGDRMKMKTVADKTGGRFYNVTNPKNLPQIFIKEARIVSRSLIQDGDLYQPAVVSTLPGPARGFPEVPAIDGYVLTAARDGLAQMPIVIGTSEGNDPLFANWNYGLGRSIAYTSDLSSLWGSRWAGWPRFLAFWEQSVRWLMRPSSPTNIHVNTRIEGDMAIVEVEALEADASFLNFARMDGVVLGPDTSSHPLPLQQIAPGKYRGQFRTGEAGAYLVNIGYRTGQGENAVQGSVQAAVTVPYAREFRAVKHNAALLRELAERTGGREILAGDPALADLFNRQGLEVPKSPKRVWDLLAMIAASLLVLDVAVRRLAIEPAWISALTRWAMGRRGEVSTATVAAWKRTRQQASHRTEQSRRAAAARTTRFEADEHDAARAIDVGKEVPTDQRSAVAGVKRTDEEAKPAADVEEGDFTQRLLAAKRRARGELKPEDEDDG